MGNRSDTADAARRAREELQRCPVRTGGRRQASARDHDSTGHPDRGSARDREVHQGSEAEEGPGGHSRRPAARHLAVERRVTGRHAVSPRTRLRGRPAFRQLQINSGLGASKGKGRMLSMTIKAPGFILLATVALTAATLYAQGSTTNDGVGTADQVKRGSDVYGMQCAACHDAQLAGSGTAPALAGTDFSANWKDETVGALFERIRATMPADNPGSLKREQVSELVA